MAQVASPRCVENKGSLLEYYGGEEQLGELVAILEVARLLSTMIKTHEE
jgi:hypothetical protein